MFVSFLETGIERELQELGEAMKGSDEAEVEKRSKHVELRLERALTIASIASRDCEDPKFSERVQQAVKNCRKRETPSLFLLINYQSTPACY